MAKVLAAAALIWVAETGGRDGPTPLEGDADSAVDGVPEDMSVLG
jgi:hypothetical protein